MQHINEQVLAHTRKNIFFCNMQQHYTNAPTVSALGLKIRRDSFFSSFLQGAIINLRKS